MQGTDTMMKKTSQSHTKKKACDFDHSPQRCGRIKNEEGKEGRKK